MLSFLGNLEGVFTWVLTASLYASVVVVLVLVVQCAFRHRLPARWRYLLWSLVLVRLVLPSVPESRLSIFNLVKLDISKTAKRSQVDRGILSANVPHQDTLPEQGTTDSLLATEHPSMVGADNLSQDGTSFTEAAQTQQPAGMPSAAADSPQNWFSLASYRRPVSMLWAFGFVFLLARAVSGHVRVRTRLLRLTKVGDPVVLALLETCQIEMDVSWKLSLVETDEDRSPAIFGLWRPQLVLPKRFLNEFSQDELRFVLLHELGHVRRHDLFVNWVLICLQAVHWFNPVIWFACRRMRSDQELACDALALSRLKVQENRAYGETIVKLLKSLTTHRSVTSAIGILEKKSSMKLRLTMISRFRKATYIQMILAMSLFLGLTAIGLTNAAGKPAGAGVSQNATKSSTKNSEKEKSTNTATRRQTPKNKDAPAETAWGKPVKGLQAGLAFEEGSKPCRVGETIRFVFKVRNVSDQAINLEYTEPVLKAWAPNIVRSDGTAVPVMPPVLPRGGRIRNPTLAQGESLTLDRNTLTIRPLGWEEPITRTVVFAEGGKHKLSHTFTFGPHPYHPSGVDRWAGELRSGELELDVIPAKSELKPRDDGVGASKEEIQIILRLLGDYERDRLTGRLADHDSEGWRRKREAWEARCAVLTAGAVDYLGYVATGHPDKGYRCVACRALGETKQGDVVRPLVKCLTDEYWRVRHTAASSLGHLRQEAIVHHLLKVLLSDDAANVRTSAAYALGHIGSNRATQGLVKALRSDDSAGVKSAAALAIGWITDPAALPVLKEVLSGADGTLRDYLEAAIRNIEDPEYWGLGTKRGKYESEVYPSLLSKLDLSAVPGTTEKRELPDLFEERPLGSGSYHMRKGVTMAFESPPTGGRVYYIRHKKVFYLREYSADPDVAHYYGPFKGNPHEIVRRIWDVRK